MGFFPDGQRATLVQVHASVYTFNMQAGIIHHKLTVKIKFYE